MSLRIKKGDTVKLLVGTQKGQTGKVLSVNPQKHSVKVENLKMVSRHHKSRSAQEQSSIIKTEGNIDISNVMLICPSCGQTTRIAATEVDGRNHRKCKKCGFDIDSKKVEKKEKKSAKVEKVDKTEKTEKTGRVKRTRKSDADKAEK